MSKHLVFELEKLRDRADEINPIDAQNTVKELKAKIKKYPDLYALSAPQIGIKERVICIKFNDGVIKEYINPMIVKSSGYHYSREKDISIPEKEFFVLRPDEIQINYQTDTAKPEQNILRGAAAETFVRMVNYLDGVVLDEDGLEIDPEWDFDNLSEKDQKELINYLYPIYIKQRSDKMNKIVDDDKDAKELKEAMEFMQAVDEGKVQFDTSITLEKKDAI